MDDMGYGDITPFNPQTKNRTPSLDRMAREGMKLTSFYACPVCTPSRAQFLTGCYAKRVSLPAVIFPAAGVGLSEKEHTIAGLLKEQGYATIRYRRSPERRQCRLGLYPLLAERGG